MLALGNTSVRHDLSSLGSPGRSSWLLRVDLHLVALGSLTLHLLFLLELVIALALDVNTAFVRQLGFVDGAVLPLFLDARHGGILASRLAVCGLCRPFDGLLFVLVDLVRAVLLVIDGEIGFGLLRRELGRC